jgi:hypothetical protein
MATFMLDPLSGRYLSFGERDEIALLRAQGTGVRKIAQRLGRALSTISRELRRNAATRGGRLEYQASVAQWKAELMARRPKTAKLVADDRLREYVQLLKAEPVVASRVDRHVRVRLTEAGRHGSTVATTTSNSTASTAGSAAYTWPAMPSRALGRGDGVDCVPEDARHTIKATATRGFVRVSDGLEPAAA